MGFEEKSSGNFANKVGNFISKASSHIVDFFHMMDNPKRGGYDMYTKNPHSGTGLIPKPSTTNGETEYLNMDDFNLSALQAPKSILNRTWTSKEGFDAVVTFESIYSKNMEAAQSLVDLNNQRRTALSKINVKAINEKVYSTASQILNNSQITFKEMEQSGIKLEQWNPSAGSTFIDTKTGEIISFDAARSRINQRLYNK